MKEEANDFGVFEFNEDEERVCEKYNNLSKLLINNPKSNDVNDAALKYQFLQHATCGPVTQIKEVRGMEDNGIVALDDDDDDDDHVMIHGSLECRLDSPPKACLKGSEGFSAVVDKVLEQHSHVAEDSVDTKISLSKEMRVDSPFGLQSGNGLMNPTFLESRFCNGSVDFGVADGNDRFEDRSPSTPASEQAENNVEGQAQDQFVGDSELDEADTIILHADYVRFGGKYFPASLVLVSKSSVKLKASVLEEETEAFCSEWKTDDILAIDYKWINTANLAKVRFRLLAKDAAQTENFSCTPAVQELEFLVHDPDWSRQHERIMALDSKYNAVLNIGPFGSCDGESVSLEERDCSSDPYIPNFEEAFEEVVYPKGDVDAVSISKSDVDLLQPEVFVNDTIIDFYITYLKNQIPVEQRQKFHFFSSFFFRKLADLDKNPSSIADGKAAFQRVRRWTRKVNIFEKDFIFIPVNYNLHWSLIVLCYPGEVANIGDENIDKALKVPCILHMDSIRGSHAGLKDLFQSYLLEEWKERQKETSEDISSKLLNLRFLSLELPQQENCSDCGLFLLHYAELFIAGAPANFSPFQINKFDNFLTPDWFMPAEASIKRVHIQRLIYELLDSRSPNCAFPNFNNLPHPLDLPEQCENDNGVEILSEGRSPGKSWSGNSLYATPVQGLGLGLLDMSSYSVPQCVDNSGLGMRELLLDQSQHYDQGTSFGQLGFPMSTIREAEDDEHLVHSTLGQTGIQQMDQVAGHESLIGSRDSDEGYQCNSDMSGQYESGDYISSDSYYSSDASDEEPELVECSLDNEVGLDQNENVDQVRENVDSLTESYASASSDMMETPAEDSQELSKKFGNNDQEDPISSNRDELIEPSQEGLDEIKDEVVAGFDNKLVVEDSSSDLDERQAEAVGVGDDVKSVVEDSSSDPDEGQADAVDVGVDEKLVVENSSLGRDEGLADAVDVGVDEKLVVENSSLGWDEGLADAMAVGVDKMLVVELDSDENQPAKRMRFTDERLPV